MNFDPRSEIHNTGIGLIIYNAEIEGQVLKLIDMLKQQGSYRVLMVAGIDTVRWVVGDGANGLCIDAEPDTGFWARCLLNLVGSWVPEGLLKTFA